MCDPSSSFGPPTKRSTSVHSLLESPTRRFGRAMSSVQWHSRQKHSRSLGGKRNLGTRGLPSSCSRWLHSRGETWSKASSLCMRAHHSLIVAHPPLSVARPLWLRPSSSYQQVSSIRQRLIYVPVSKRSLQSATA